MPAGERRRRNAELARNCLKVFAAQQRRSTAAVLRCRDILATAAERRYARLLRSLLAALGRAPMSFA